MEQIRNDLTELKIKYEYLEKEVNELKEMLNIIEDKFDSLLTSLDHIKYLIIGFVAFYAIDNIGVVEIIKAFIGA